MRCNEPTGRAIVHNCALTMRLRRWYRARVTPEFCGAMNMSFSADPGIAMALVNCSYAPGRWNYPSIPPAFSADEYIQLIKELRLLLSRRRPAGRRHRFVGALPSVGSIFGPHDTAALASWTELIVLFRKSTTNFEPNSFARVCNERKRHFQFCKQKTPARA